MDSKNKYALLEKQILELRTDVQRKLLDHLEYHRENEAKWGLVKIMRDHPFKTLLIGIAIGISMLGLLNANDIITFLAGVIR